MMRMEMNVKPMRVKQDDEEERMVPAALVTSSSVCFSASYIE